MKVSLDDKLISITVNLSPEDIKLINLWCEKLNQKKEEHQETMRPAKLARKILAKILREQKLELLKEKRA